MTDLLFFIFYFFTAEMKGLFAGFLWDLERIVVVRDREPYYIPKLNADIRINFLEIWNIY